MPTLFTRAVCHFSALWHAQLAILTLIAEESGVPRDKLHKIDTDLKEQLRQVRERLDENEEESNND